ncbi:FadR family transcriptional regulator [Rhodococcus pseudokoreensis]|jgi:GntR family transcriptional repressor for pyruvate dehydrogenase complex|uniref:FadR family transcriptional regulator n=1 Tax=Rhodococcus pseudokoreensis TaxID=2811421 RepID=A0A974W8F0_9NOCA|nr:GntR family transcriptional regulator [Rhodococcus pseudokoreensis]QSE92572.1 FadR family transcriptional regulator [Rhodococcus pseudokoreensis]
MTESAALFQRQAEGSPIFTKVQTRRGFEYIYEQISGAVAEGQLKPGDRLPAEREMAQIFGIARQSVREALRALEASGLVESRLGVTGGVFIRTGDPTVVSRAMTNLASLGGLSHASVLEARIILTSDIIRMACERATEEDFQKLDEDITFTEQQSKTEAGLERTAQIMEFYHILASATHNEVLVMLTDSLSQIVYLRLNRAGPKPSKDIGKVRRRILNHLRARDADKAIAEISRHLKRLEKVLVEAEKAKELELDASS